MFCIHEVSQELEMCRMLWYSSLLNLYQYNFNAQTQQ